LSDQVQIENELLRLTKALETASNEYTELCRLAARARDDYDVAKARALLKTNKELKVDEKKAEALLACEPLMRDAHIQESMRDAMKERIRALSDILNATQTRASFLKEEMRLAGRFN
jgi:hypothetical protein